MAETKGLGVAVYKQIYKLSTEYYALDEVWKVKTTLKTMNLE
jgi:hypothetical protein